MASDFWRLENKAVLYQGDCLEELRSLPSQSVHLVITSPPYVGNSADWGATWHASNAANINDWLGLVWSECLRVLKPGGKMIVNLANTRRRPYVPNAHAFYSWAERKLNGRERLELAALGDERDQIIAGSNENGRVGDAEYRRLEQLVAQMSPYWWKIEPIGEIIWNKGYAQLGTAWGTYRSPSDLALADQHEYLIVTRAFGKRERPASYTPIPRKQFLRWRNSVWSVPPESAARIGHPTPFPLEIPRRLTIMYSFEGEVVLDPFAGSGTTGHAALLLGRKFIGIEKDAHHFDLMAKRLDPVVRQSDFFDQVFPKPTSDDEGAG